MQKIFIKMNKEESFKTIEELSLNELKEVSSQILSTLSSVSGEGDYQKEDFNPFYDSEIFISIDTPKNLMIVEYAKEDLKDFIVVLAAEIIKRINSDTIVSLPCELGTRVYVIIDEFDAKHMGCACCLADYGFKTKCEYYQNNTCINTSQYKYRIISRRFELSDVYKFGKTVFLTTEEAEEELKKILNKRNSY